MRIILVGPRLIRAYKFIERKVYHRERLNGSFWIWWN